MLSWWQWTGGTATGCARSRSLQHAAAAQQQQHQLLLVLLVVLGVVVEGVVEVVATSMEARRGQSGELVQQG